MSEEDSLQGTTVNTTDLEKLFCALWDRTVPVVPIGTIVPFGSSTLGGKAQRWLLCHGQAISINKYGGLFDVIEMAFGGSTADKTFNVPDLRGRFVRGVDVQDEGDEAQWRDPDHARRAESGKDGNVGNMVGSLQHDCFKKHAHRTGVDTQQFLSWKLPGDKKAGGKYHSYLFNFPPKTRPEGGNETRPKNVGVEWLIYAGPPKGEELSEAQETNINDALGTIRDLRDKHGIWTDD